MLEKPFVSGGYKNLAYTVTVIMAVAVGGCDVLPVNEPSDDDPRYNNSTDPTNKSANYVGANACRNCHESINAVHSMHGHVFSLTRIQGQPPEFPVEGTRAGVPNPPEGFTWADIAYVIGGYTRGALFIDNGGFIYTTGVDGVDTQWNLSFPVNGTEPEFAAYESGRETPRAYDFSCFQCHTTGALPQDVEFPEFQENRTGFAGTWEEAGVQCEACHGPGSNHFTTVGSEVVIDRSAVFVNVGADQCGACHTRSNDPDIILGGDGYISNYQQWPELLASGGHAGFNCTTCHDPHVSVNYVREDAIRNECTDCHADQNLAIHEGVTFVRGDYVEPVTCESCHMPFATRSAASAGPDVVGDDGRMGDTRTHIFRINASATAFSSMFTGDGSTAIKDEEGRASVSLDFVCFRCHSGVGNAPAFSAPQFAADVASGMHDVVRP